MLAVPLLVFDAKGIPATGREGIETAVEAGGKHMRESYQAWITTDPCRGAVRVIITAHNGVSEQSNFAMDEEPHETTERVRTTMDE